jgi:hypothetical protein
MSPLTASSWGRESLLISEVRGLTAAPAQSGQPVGAGEDALLLSGLAMAGANQRWSGEGEDGPTALEATSLDLRGTRLVVLSACETGVGDARSGEGVYGLRRAGARRFRKPGDEPAAGLDTATRDLMIAYYRWLRAGEGRADAAAGAARDAGGRGAGAPFYWASFIQSGDWRPARLTMTRDPAITSTRRRRGHRGAESLHQFRNVFRNVDAVPPVKKLGGKRGRLAWFIAGHSGPVSMR